MATKMEIRDAKDRDMHIAILADRWNESFMAAKHSVAMLSDKDVRIMADSYLFNGECR